jgi:hypothetical protein
MSHTATTVQAMTALDHKGFSMSNDIHGSGGKGGGSQFYEADNSLQSTATVKVLEVISQGPITGLVNGAKGIYLNNVPVENADGTFNFGGKVGWDQRVGLPSQPIMSGFPSSSVVFPVSTQVTNTTPVVYTVSDPTVDAIRVTIGLNDGLVEQLTTENRVIGSTVELSIDRRLGVGPWEQVSSFAITGKTTSPYEEGHLIQRAGTSGSWAVRVSRITADNQTSTLRNNTYFSRATEIQYANLEYPDWAYIGLSVDAKTVNSSSVPTRSYLVDGIKVKVPSNYNPTTRTYTGIWDGTFKFATTSNPAWVLYDMIANPRYGLGEYVAEADIDKYSFYDAGVYCDGLVSSLPRFTFNYWIAGRQDALKWIQDVAGTMNSKVVWMGGKVTVVQDRPGTVARLITTSNVTTEGFTYRSSAQQERPTAVNITWNNPNNHYQQEVVVIDQYTVPAGALKTKIEAAAAIYGYKTEEIVALGCTDEAQARRVGLWRLDTSLYQTEVASWKMAMNGLDIGVGDIVELYDENYAGPQQAGRLAAGSTTTVINLDRAVTITAGSTISLLINGVVEQKSISTAPGLVSQVTVSSAFSAIPPEYTDFLISTMIAPRQFRITNVKLDADMTASFDAIYHDPNKYARIENSSYVVPPVYSAINDYAVSAPGIPVFREESVSEDNSVTRTLIVSWARPTDGIVSGYKVKWQVNNGGFINVDTTQQSIDIIRAVPGTYQVEVYAVGFNNVLSTRSFGTYYLSVDGILSSVLNPVTNLGEINDGSDQFTRPDLSVKWINPVSNGGKLSTLRDFEVTVSTVLPTGLIPEDQPFSELEISNDFFNAPRVIFPTDELSAAGIRRVEYMPYVLPGDSQRYDYTYDKNRTDSGNGADPLRSFYVSVRCRDTANNFTPYTTRFFSNPPPAVPSGIVATGTIGAVNVKFNKPTEQDYAGTKVWMSTTSGFTPGPANLVYDGNATFIALNVPDDAQRYVRVAHYDSFGTNDSGAGLNISSQVTVTPIVDKKASAGVARRYIYSGGTAVSTTSGSIPFSVLTTTGYATQACANGHLNIYLDTDAATIITIDYSIYATDGTNTYTQFPVSNSIVLSGGNQRTATTPTTYYYAIPFSLNWFYCGDYWVSTYALPPGQSGIIPVPYLVTNFLTAGTWTFGVNFTLNAVTPSTSTPVARIAYVNTRMSGWSFEHRGSERYNVPSPFI